MLNTFSHKYEEARYFFFLGNHIFFVEFVSPCSHKIEKSLFDHFHVIFKLFFSFLYAFFYNNVEVMKFLFLIFLDQFFSFNRERVRQTTSKGMT